MKDKTIIELDRVCKSYLTGEVETVVLRDASLKIRGRDFVAVLGPSGCGKTTLLNLIGGLDKPTSGSIYFMGEEISQRDSRYTTKLRKDNFGFVFQFYNLIPTLTALENVEIILELSKLEAEEIRHRAVEYLRRVGLGGRENQFPAQLSGGEQQRVAIARALAKEPKIVLADEPTGNLDEAAEHKTTELMLTLNRELETTFLVVTHNKRVAERANRIVRIREGHIEKGV